MIEDIKTIFTIIDVKGFLGPFLFLLAGLSALHVTVSLRKVKELYGVSGVLTALMTSIMFCWWTILYGGIALMTGKLYSPGGHMISGIQATAGGLLLLLIGVAIHGILLRKVREIGDTYTEQMLST